MACTGASWASRSAAFVQRGMWREMEGRGAAGAVPEKPLEWGARQGVAEPSEEASVLWKTPQELSTLDPG